jgi:outer membrane receptor protein involved in Fe transport
MSQQYTIAVPACRFSRIAGILSIIGVLLYGLSVTAGAQNRTLGEIQGTVTDTTSARIPGAEVTLANTMTGIKTKAITNSSGVYDVEGMVPGTYSVTFVKEGFKTSIQEDVLLNAGVIIVNSTLDAGAATQEVKVSTESSQLQTESAELRTDVSEVMVQELPNVGQSELNFTALIPGIQPGGNSGSSQINNNTNITVNGTGTAEQAWTIDGALRTLITGGETLAVVPPDDIANINYLTGNFGAEYGNGSAVFNVITKGGTNQWHGSAYEYVQNAIFNARNYFSPTVSPVHWNMYGGTVGGPIKKDKAFFFFSYMNNPDHLNIVGYYTFPTLAMRNGDFSGLPVTVYDPNSLTTVNGKSTRTPLPNNMMTPSQISPIAKAIESYLPLPNLPGYANNLLFQGPDDNSVATYNWKVDYDIARNNRIDSSLMWNTENNQRSYQPGAPFNYQLHEIIGQYNGQISDFWTITPHIVSEARFAIQRFSGTYNEPDYGKGYSKLVGLQSLSQMFPGLSWSGYFSSSFNNEHDATLDENVFIPSETLTWVKGSHILKLGGEFDKYQDNELWQVPDVYSFSGIATANPSDPSSAGLGYADFLFGDVSSWSSAIPPETGARAWNAQLFAQDDYKAKPNLTFNIGLRYEMASFWGEAENRIGNFDPTLMNPATNSLGAMVYGASSASNPTVPKTRYGLFGPRVGFSWSPRPNWVVRGGYGIYYYMNGLQNYGGSVGLGFTTQGSATSTDSIHPAFQWDQNQPGYVLPSPATRTPESLNGQTIGYAPYSMSLGSSEQWQFNIQREIGTFIIDAAYVGTHGVHLPFGRDFNQVPTNLISLFKTGADMQQYRPYPQFSTINAIQNDGWSNYNALQLSLRKQFSSGLSLIANYTRSKTLDTFTNSAETSNGGGDDYQNAYDIGANYGPSLSDIPNLFAGGLVAPVPVGQGRRFLNHGGLTDAVLGGWQLSGQWQLHSGLTYTPTIGSENESGALSGSWYPNRTGSGVLAHPTVQEWFDTSAFTTPAVGTFGDSGRNILRGPGWEDVDLALGKSFKIRLLGEASALQVRFDSTDVFNHPNFINPDSSLNTAGVGKITYANTSRSAQVGAHLRF